MAEAPKRLRCAVYTRKSSEEGLDQAFNSLHAQREACEAYILSQKHEGWQLIPTAYDDGGFSGGSMARPALKALLGDVAAGLVDIIVVYKVDRLTRSLADFAKMVEAFDSKAVSFVSVTQAFNTTTSMGRLTLNVLLSFAQFEREVTGERIRDKIAASKAKGMWMGGVVPLGYDVEDRKLIVNVPEAVHVRTLFERYLVLRSADAVVEYAFRYGICSKRHATMSGVHRGGARITRGSLYRILANPLYAGDVGHRGKFYAGQHDAIVARDSWDAVQALLASQRRKGCGTSASTKRHHRFAPLVHAGDGTRLRATHTRQGSKRYDYYVGAGLRIPAATLDALIVDTVVWHLGDPAKLAALLIEIDGVSPERIARGRQIACLFENLDTADDGVVIVSDIERITIGDRTLAIVFPPTALDTEQPVVLTVPTAIASRGDRLSLVLPGAIVGNPDPALVTAIAQARSWFAELASGAAPSIDAIAQREAVSPGYVSTLIPAAFLAPAIVRQIVAGRQPPTLTRHRMIAMLPLAPRWEDQVAMLGA